ncbi:MAG: hypothetical protein M1827_000206 [Pycnora praestabilis]|nr:MAG: hypothetical protein M1827_000206 [Pycnora praestabilis]
MSAHIASNYTSPKRKRDASEMIAASPEVSHSDSRLNTDMSSFSIPALPDSHASGEGSPRTVVASQLEDLKLKVGDVGDIGFGTFNVGNTHTKRFRLDDTWGAHEANVEHNGKIRDTESQKPGVDSSTAILQGLGPSFDLGRSQVAFQPKFGNTTQLSIGSMQPSRPKARRKSPPPPAFTVTHPELDSLTWHENEITGHDPNDPEDTGEGLNGIGFKPTPAMAYNRSQHRKQQIMEWKNREARDARQKRSERRRGGAKLGAAAESHALEVVTRKVRFL